MISKKYRISNSSRVEIVKNFGKKVYSPFLKVSFLPNGLNYQRFAVVVSTKVCKISVYRNYVRRAIMEGSRRSLLHCQFGADIVFFVLNSINKKKYEEIVAECEMILKKVQILFHKIKLPINPSFETKPNYRKRLYSPLVLALKKTKYKNSSNI
ncbi:MAG: ribonuclease P protein component [Patescibacteria group bacterium]|nr:ribonuclease P protein component [Patescibacteria group bacterium]